MATLYSPKIVTDGLVLYYDAANNKSYVSGSATIGNLTQITSSGTVSPLVAVTSSNHGALIFSSGSFINTNYSQSGINEYTIEAWIKTNNNGNSGQLQGIVQNRGPNGNAVGNFSLGLVGSSWGPPGTNGNLFFVMDSDSIGVGPYSSTTYNDNRWHQLVGVLEHINNGVALATASAATYMKIYADGNELVPATYWGVGSINAPFSGIGTTKIGWHEAANLYFSGSIAMVRLYNKALTAAQVLQNYNANRGRYIEWPIPTTASGSTGGGGTGSLVYLISEDFESTVDSNISFNYGGNLQFTNWTDPLPLDGTKCAKRDNSNQYVQALFPAQDDYWMYFKFAMNGGGQLVAAGGASLSNNGANILQGFVPGVGYVGPWTTTADYDTAVGNAWVNVKKGTGTNGEFHFYVNSSSIRPAAPLASITNTLYTGGETASFFIGGGSANPSRLDCVRIASTELFDRGNLYPTTASTYLVSEDFVFGADPLNWYISPPMSWELDATYPMGGTKSAHIIGTNTVMSCSFAPQDEVWVFGSCRVATGDEYLWVCDLGSTTEQLVAFGAWGTGNMRYVIGGSDSFPAGDVPRDTVFYYWVHYVKGTGSNGSGEIYTSTTTTRPSTPDKVWTNSTSTSQASVLLFSGGGGSPNRRWGKLRISTTEIGDDPI